MCQPIATASIWNDSDDSTRVHQKRWNAVCRGRLISGSWPASSTSLPNASGEVGEVFGATCSLVSAGGVFIVRWIVVPYDAHDFRRACAPALRHRICTRIGGNRATELACSVDASFGPPSVEQVSPACRVAPAGVRHDTLRGITVTLRCTFQTTYMNA